MTQGPAPIRLHRVAELTPALMADLAAGGYRAVRDPELVIYVADQPPAFRREAGGERREQDEGATADADALPVAGEEPTP